MREIKFRGRWEHPHDEYLTGWKYAALTDKGLSFDLQVNPKTIGQYLDVYDINNKEVCEGDIVKRTAYMRDYAECDGEVIEIYEVSYNAPLWLPFSEISMNMEEYEIIGNIHDNPELLTKTKL